MILRALCVVGLAGATCLAQVQPGQLFVRNRLAKLVGFDPATGTGTSESERPVGETPAWAFAPDGELYGYSFHTRRIITVDPLTGIIDQSRHEEPAHQAVNLTFHPTTGELYGHTQNQVAGGGLIRFDPATGEATPLGQLMGVGADSDVVWNADWGLAWTPDGSRLIGLAFSRVLEIDITTMTAEVIGEAGPNVLLRGLEFDPVTGRAFSTSAGSLVSFDLDDLVPDEAVPLTTVGSLQDLLLGPVSDLAMSPIPAPASAGGLLALSMIGLRRRR